jgi:DUF4097 and DUF4098 domain-containing protein YvlB
MRERAWSVIGLTAACLALAAVPGWAQDTDAAWLAQCRNDGGSRARYCEVRPISWPAGGPIHVDARPNGGVRITGGGQGVSGSARLQAQADTEADAQALAGQVVIATSGGILRAEGPKPANGRSWSVSFVLSVPQQSDIEVECVNGPVALEGVSGRIRATTTNGPVSLKDLGGSVQAHATNGPVTVSLSGSSWNGNGLDVETTNGPMKVSIPDGYSAQLDVATSNGPFHVGIPGVAQGDTTRSHALNAPIGAGGATIRAHTTNGPLSVDRR